MISNFRGKKKDQHCYCGKQFHENRPTDKLQQGKFIVSSVSRDSSFQAITWSGKPNMFENTGSYCQYRGHTSSEMAQNFGRRHAFDLYWCFSQPMMPMCLVQFCRQQKLAFQALKCFEPGNNSHCPKYNLEAFYTGVLEDNNFQQRLKSFQYIRNFVDG